MPLSVRPGDVLFLRGGEPSVVTGFDKMAGKIRAAQDERSVTDHIRHGYINGLSEGNRQEFMAILDQVKGTTEDPTERIQLLRTRLDTLEQDPKQQSLARYLRSEMTHMMAAYGVKPREFTIDEERVRST